MKGFKKMVCRDVKGEYGHTVLFTSTDYSEIAAYLDKCRIFSKDFADLLESDYPAIVCKLDNIQYTFFK